MARNIDTMTDEEFAQWLMTENDASLENESDAHKHYIAASKNMKAHPFDLDALTKTDEPQRCIVPFVIAGKIESALRNANIPYTYMDSDELIAQIGRHDYDELANELLSRTGDPEAVAITMPYTVESINAYMKGYIDSNLDAFWTSWHEYRDAKRAFDDEFDGMDMARERQHTA